MISGKRYFNDLSIGIIGLVVIELVFHLAFITKWIWHLFSLGIILLAANDKKFQPVRKGWLAVLPFAIVSFLSDIVKLIDSEFYSRVDQYFTSIGAVVWIMTQSWATIHTTAPMFTRLKYWSTRE